MAQQKLLEQLEREIEKLKISRDLDSQTSSKPPSTDLLKKPENAKIPPEKETSSSSKRKPGGQPGHQGQTRKGFSYRLTASKFCNPSNAVSVVTGNF